MSTAPLTATAAAALVGGRIRPVATSFTYRLALLVVALLMLALPLIYLGLIGLTGYGLWYHAVHDLEVLRGTRGRSAFWGFIILYLGPLVAGIALLVCLVKPLFARRQLEDPSFPLPEGAELALRNYVESVADAVGAPRPSEVRVDCQVNASASFRGAWGMLTGRLVLTLGMPLLLRLNLRQLTGIVAHEYGHFAQGAAMRANWLIAAVDRWFARAVYERDAWDTNLVRWTESAGQFHLALAIVGWLARFCVWLTRRVLWVFFAIGRLASLWLSRQMEYDADRHSARVVGGSVFADTMPEVRRLAIGEQIANNLLGQAWRTRRLPDDFPLLIAGARDDLTPEQLLAIAKTPERATGWFDSHPSDSDRRRMLAIEQDQPLLTDESPALRLLADPNRLSRATSKRHFECLLGEERQRARFVATDEILGRHRSDAQSASQRHAVFGDRWCFPWLPKPDQLHADEARPAPGPALRAAQQALQHEAQPSLFSTVIMAEDLRHEKLAHAAVNAALRQGLGECIPLASVQSLASFHLQTIAVARLDGQRLIAALDLVAAAEAPPMSSEEAQTLHQTLLVLSGLAPVAMAMIDHLIAVQALLNHVEKVAEDLRPRLVEHATQQLSALHRFIHNDLARPLKGLRHPFVDGGTTLAEDIVSQPVPSSRDLSLIDHAAGCLSAVARNWERCLGSVAGLIAWAEGSHSNN